MANENLKKALEKAMLPEYEELLSSEVEHEFSPQFEKKMDKLIKRRKKPYYKLINTVGKRVACIAVIIIVASSVTVMSVDALREIVADFFVSVYEKYSTIQSVDTLEAPKTIEDIYEITYDLSDYNIVFEDEDSYSYNITYSKNDITIDFYQYTKDMYDVNINTEGAEISTIYIDGNEAITYMDNHGYYHIIINAEDYVFYFSSNIGENELIKVVKSVQKVKQQK